MQSTVPSAAPVLLSQCVNPDQLKTERLENTLHPCGKCWLNNSKFSFLRKMTKVHSFSQRLMLVHRFSASKIVETELEDRFSSLLHLVADKRLPLLHLICLFLVLFLKYCNGLSLSSQQASCVMSAPSPHRFFLPLGGLRRLFLRLPVSMGSTLGGLCDSRFYSAWIIILFQGRFSGWIFYLAFSFRLRGFDATNRYWCRKPNLQRTSTLHVLQHFYSVISHACQ